MNVEERVRIDGNGWEPVQGAFLEWLNNREKLLEPGLAPEPTIKVLTFLALLDANKACTYEDIREIFHQKKVIHGDVPDNTLRTSVLNLGKSLEKFQHSLQLKSFRGRFQLIEREHKATLQPNLNSKKKSILVLDEPVIDIAEIARVFIEKAMLPFNALYFLEWSARCWEIYSRQEAESRVVYEAGAWEKLGIKQRLIRSNDESLIVVSLGPSEGLAEIELIKNILNSGINKIHYLSIDSSPRLLRNHMGLFEETFSSEIAKDRLLAVGIVADIFSNLHETIKKAKNALIDCGIIISENDFLPSLSPTLVTYFGNCLGNDGNNTQDPEASFFSTIRSAFQSRPLEILVGVSVMRSEPDQYKRNWDDFLLQTPRHLLNISHTFQSSQDDKDRKLPEFTLLPKDSEARCPAVIPEPYFTRHQIKGQIYRFYYRLAFDLKLAIEQSNQESKSLPEGTLILLYNIIKYDMQTLVTGIEKSGLFKVKYDPNYHQIVRTDNGIREYAVFSAYLE